jgi:hypothetical protein
MSDLSPKSPTPIRRAVVTRDGAFTLLLPFAARHSQVRTPRGTHIRAIRRDMQRLLNDGYRVRCPVTNEVLSVYVRHLSRNHVETLGRLAMASLTKGRAWLKIREFSARRDGDLAKLRYWGLAETLAPAQCLEGEQPRGMWRITPAGMAWLRRETKVPRSIVIFRNEFLGFYDGADLVAADEVNTDFDLAALFGQKAS